MKNDSQNNKTELLAPAKDLETGLAAVNFGADAVYIGAKSFGARHSAGNSLDDIKKLVDYAHLFNVKIHVTVNTILTDDELYQAVDLINELYKINVDAIIVQDMGIINLAIKGKLPPILIHASTQCNNRTIEKVQFLENIGVSRVILARELSKKQINEICKNTKAEIETFIHGALCVSYSGQCYLSYAIGGRSANRGECAQPCRKKYSLIDENGKYIAKEKYLLSMKDFYASKHLESLVNSGVKSFKIEGRLKDINYVKNVVSYYRKQLDKISTKTSSGKIFTDFEPAVEKSFNRGFTSYFLENREKCFNIISPKNKGYKTGIVKNSGTGWFELDNKCEFNPQDGICFICNEEQTGCLVNKFENNKVYLNKKITIPKGTKIYKNNDSKFENILTNSNTVRKIRVNFELKNNILSATDEDGNRTELKITETEKPNNEEKMAENIKKQLQKTGESIFYAEEVKTDNNIPFIPVSKINEYRRLILENLKNERIKNYKREVQKPLKYIKYLNSQANYHENIHNHEAEEFYANCGCEVLEKSLESTNYFGGKELMRTKHCLKYAFDMCKSPKKLFLIDEKGKKYPLKFDCKNCEMVICGR